MFIVVAGAAQVVINQLVSASFNRQVDVLSLDCLLLDVKYSITISVTLLLQMIMIYLIEHET